jgi:dTMP kinase
MPAEIHEAQMDGREQAQAQRASPLRRHVYTGRLIAAEGLDGSGKSTQLQLLRFWLQAEGYEVLIVEWSSSKLIKRALKSGRKEGSIDAMLMSVLYASDLAELHERDIVPALRRGAIVLADRYVYTALARDLARGVERAWVEDLYRFAVRPDLGIYFQISAEQSLERILSNHPRLNYFQAGMDLGLSSDPIASFRELQQRILGEYEAMVEAYGLLLFDATLPIKQQQQLLRGAVEQILPGE